MVHHQGDEVVFILLLTLLLIDGILLTVIVLLQAGKGGGLAAVGGGGGGTMADNLIGGRQAATLLTKATWVTGGLFMGLSLVLAVLSSRATTPEPLLRDTFQTAPPAPEPLLPSGSELPITTPPEGGADGAGTGDADPPPTTRP